MVRRIIPLLAVAVTAFLTGCGSPVEAFDLLIESPGGTGEVELRDLSRRPPEEEGLVSATMEESPRYRVEGWSELIRDVPIRGVLLPGRRKWCRRYRPPSPLEPRRSRNVSLGSG